MSAARDRVSQLVDAARKKIQSGDRDEALALLRDALDIDPDNAEARQELDSLEREIAAMKAFSRSRSSRVASAHDGPAAVSSEDFIKKCLERSQKALEEGDEVRALQELERAQRQDPENQNVRKRIRLVKRSIKAANLADNALTMLKNGNVAGALGEARRIFDFWPSHKSLPDLLSRIEEAAPVEEAAIEEEGAAEVPAREEQPEEEIEEIEELLDEEEVEEVEEEYLEEVEEEPPVEVEEEVAEEEEPEVPAREAELIASIREKIASSAFPEALREAREALREFPDSTTISELNAKLARLAGPLEEGEEEVAAAPSEIAEEELVEELAAEEVEEEEKAAVTPSKPAEKTAPSRARPVRAPREEKEGRKLPIPLIAGVAGAIVAVLLVVFVVLPMLGGESTEDNGDTEPVPEPYDAVIALDMPSDVSAEVLLDGSPLQPGADGAFHLSGTDFGNRSLEVRAEGYEVLEQGLELSEGALIRDTLRLDTLGTSDVSVSFSLAVPEDVEEPSPEEIVYFADGVEVSADSFPLVLKTGTHVFLAEVPGLEAVPETIVVTRPGELDQTLMVRSPDTAEIRLTLAGDIEGTADWYVDGSRVQSGGRSLVHVAPQGDHTLLARMDEREDWYRSITLDEDGYTATVSPAEIVQTGRLIIDPEPWADVYIDGDNVGQTPLPPIELDQGDYTVRLTNPDYEDQVSTITISAGEDSRISYTADPIAVEDTTAMVVEEPIIPPFATSQIQPVYPDLALERGDIDGYVTLEVTVGTDGSVLSATVVNDEVGLGCGQAALDAVYQWQFSPATQGGVPLESTTTVSMRFYLP